MGSYLTYVWGEQPSGMVAIVALTVRRGDGRTGVNSGGYCISHAYSPERSVSRLRRTRIFW
jgi:hypothetical protein